MDKSDEEPRDVATLEDFEFYWQLHELEVTYDVHAGNYRELRLVLDEFIHPENARALMRPENRAKFEETMKEVVRRLHNFVASANTLVDHTRRHVRRFYRGTAFQTEYESEKRRRFDESDLQKFAKDLRNYSLHVRLPDVWASLAANGTKVRSLFDLSVPTLLEWKKWSAQSHKYLERVGDEVDIAHVVADYMRMIKEFYSWLRSREYELNAALIARVRSHLERSRNV